MWSSGAFHLSDPSPASPRPISQVWREGVTCANHVPPQAFHSIPCMWSHDFLPLVGAGRGESCQFSPLLWDLSSMPAFSFLCPPDGYCTHQTSSEVFQHSRPSTSSHARSGASITGSSLEYGSQVSTWRQDSLLAALHHPHLSIRETSPTTRPSGPRSTATLGLFHVCCC